MSGPIAIEYILARALLELAWGAYQEAQNRRIEQAQHEQAIADKREEARRAAIARRDEERRSREAARQRAERAAELLIQARNHEQRLERAHALAEEARTRFPDTALEMPALPQAPSNREDPDEIQRYIGALQGTVRLLEQRVREQASRAATQQGLHELMSVLEETVEAEPRTAADLLALYAKETRALSRPAAGEAMNRQATAQRILGRLSGIEAGAVPPELDALMRKLIEAESEARAQMLAMELRARVQQFNAERERGAHEAAENRSREMAGVLVAEVLSDLGYEVEPITDTLFVSGGMAHFQRAEWGDYYVRMRVDPATSNINFNMVRATDATAPPDAAQRKRDEEMEAAWCTGIPKLLAELAARGIDSRKLRELDAGAVPVQAVRPESIDPILRQKEDAGTTAPPREMARPIKR
jgi:hypothetical protein